LRIYSTCLSQLNSHLFGKKDPDRFQTVKSYEHITQLDQSLESFKKAFVKFNKARSQQDSSSGQTLQDLAWSQVTGTESDQSRQREMKIAKWLWEKDQLPPEEVNARKDMVSRLNKDQSDFIYDLCSKCLNKVNSTLTDDAWLTKEEHTTILNKWVGQITQVGTPPTAALEIAERIAGEKAPIPKSLPKIKWLTA